LSWKVWTASQREQLRQRNDLAGRSLYHKSFQDVPLEYATSNPRTTWNALGFKYYSGATHTSICFPCWFASLLTALLPVVWIVRWVQRLTRAKAGHCTTCGYDLRASPDRCPECGAVGNQSAAPIQS
jgi:hypothetical protein